MIALLFPLTKRGKGREILEKMQLQSPSKGEQKRKDTHVGKEIKFIKETQYKKQLKRTPHFWLSIYSSALVMGTLFL